MNALENDLIYKHRKVYRIQNQNMNQIKKLMLEEIK